MSKPVYYTRIGSNESSYRRKALTESTHNKVYLIGKSEMVADASPLLSEHTESVSLIDHYSRVVLVFKTNYFGKIGKVAFHRENTIHHDQFDSIRLAFLEFFFQIGHIVMFVLQLSRKGETAAIYDGSVHAVVTDNVIVTSRQLRNNTLIYSKSGGKTECIVFS